MAIVLPKKKKRVDIFAPRKSVQDAKEKLGPAFFDPSLLECSRNAVELTKLVNKWEDIDKEKVKFMRELSREQNAMIKLYRKNLMAKKDERQTENESFEDCTETHDGKQIPPGFRFRSNGDLKPSLVSMPHLSVSDLAEDIDDQTNQTELTDANSKSNTNILVKDRSSYDAVNYTREIDALRGVIIELCEELSKSKISLSKSHSGSIRSFLRSHTTEYTSVTDFGGELDRSPNDRFAFQPGSSDRRNLYKQTLKTPSSRVCTGCQFKLKQQSDDLQKLKVKQEKDILKRRWSYVPTGKYVQSSAALSSTSLHRSGSLSRPSNEDQIESKNSKPSLVQFRVDSEIVSKKAVLTSKIGGEQTQAKGRSKSSPLLNRRAHSAVVIGSTPVLTNDRSVARKDSELNERRSLHSSLSKRSTLKSGSSATSETYGLRRSLWSSLSCGSSVRARTSSRLLTDYDSRLSLLKEYQVEQKKQCDSKVKKFLHDLDSVQKEGT